MVDQLTAADESPDLIIEELSKAYQRSVLNGASASFPSGHVVAILGENGSGKTTLFKCMLGLESFSGSVRFGGAMSGRSLAGGDIFGVFDESTMYPTWTVAKNIEYQLNDGTAASSPTVRSLLPKDLLVARAGRLSAGQTRLVLIAIAVASSAKVLLLDEFSNGLDRSTRARVRGALESVVDSGRTVIASGHDLAVFEGFADRLYILKDGVLHDGTAHYERTASLEETYDSFHE